MLRARGFREGHGCFLSDQLIVAGVDAHRPGYFGPCNSLMIVSRHAQRGNDLSATDSNGCGHLTIARCVANSAVFIGFRSDLRTWLREIQWFAGCGHACTHMLNRQNIERGHSAARWIWLHSIASPRGQRLKRPVRPRRTGRFRVRENYSYRAARTSSG
jgi:hypothetical protein